MGIAALVIGIVAVILGFIPFCGFFALIPAIVGLILGCVDVSIKAKKQLPRGCGVAGIVLNAVAIIFIVIWLTVFAASAAATTAGIAKAIEEMPEGTTTVTVQGETEDGTKVIEVETTTESATEAE